MIVEHPKKVPRIMRLNLMSHEHQRKSADLGKDDGDERAKAGIWRDARFEEWKGSPRFGTRPDLLCGIYFVAALAGQNLGCRDYGLGSLPMNELDRIG